MWIADLIAAAIFLMAIFVFIKAPIHKSFESPPWIDPAIGFFFTSLVVIYVYVAHYAMKFVPETAYSPCGQFSKQIECYNISTETCMIGWNSSRGDCDEKMAAIQKERPAALLGTLLETCISRNFDKSMHYNRKNENTQSCTSYFNRIDQK